MMPNYKSNIQIMRKSYKILRAFCEIALDKDLLNSMDDNGLNNILTENLNIFHKLLPTKEQKQMQEITLITFCRLSKKQQIEWIISYLDLHCSYMPELND